MKVVKLFWASYTIMGVFMASLLLAACSSGGGGEPQLNTPTPKQGTVVNTPRPTPTATPTQTAALARTPTPTVAVAPTATAGKTPTTTSVVQTPPSASGQEIKVSMRNNKFPEEIHVKAGSKVVFVVTNESDNDEHSFELPDFELTRKAKAGETIRIEWQVPSKKGKWDAGCFLTQPGGVHDGMEGLLIIE